MNVYASSEVVTKLWTIIENIKTEVGGFGYAHLDGPDTLIWDEVFLVPQQVNAAEVEFTSGGIEAAVNRAAEDNVLNKEGFVWVSWHSHHSMRAFWSGTDDKCIETYGAAGIPYLLSFVGCHDHEYKMRFDMFNVEHRGAKISHVTLDELTLDLDSYDPVFDAIFKEITSNVTEKKFRLKGAKPKFAAADKRTIDEKVGDALEHMAEYTDGFDALAWDTELMS